MARVSDFSFFFFPYILPSSSITGVCNGCQFKTFLQSRKCTFIFSVTDQIKTKYRFHCLKTDMGIKVVSFAFKEREIMSESEQFYVH